MFMPESKAVSLHHILMQLNVNQSIVTIFEFHLESAFLGDKCLTQKGN